MNLRATLSGLGAATLLVAVPGWALANSASIGGDLSGSAIADESGLSGEGQGNGEAGADFALPGTPDAPDAPEAPESSGNEAPELPHAPEVPEAPDAPDAPDTPDAPDAPDAPEVEQPATPDAPQGSGSRSDGSGETRVRADGKGSLSGSVGGDREPQADHDADANGEAESNGHKISVP